MAQHMTKRGVGRPPLDDPRDNLLQIRINDEEIDLFHRAAAATGQTVSAFMRGAAVFAANDALREKP